MRMACRQGVLLNSCVAFSLEGRAFSDPPRLALRMILAGDDLRQQQQCRRVILSQGHLISLSTMRYVMCRDVSDSVNES